MYIHEAVERALPVGAYIRRSRAKHWKGLKVRPTNEPTKHCFLITEKGERPRWQPSADDLMAGDWEVLNEGSYDQFKRGEKTLNERRSEREFSVIKDGDKLVAAPKEKQKINTVYFFEVRRRMWPEAVHHICQNIVEQIKAGVVFLEPDIELVAVVGDPDTLSSRVRFFRPGGKEIK